MVSVRQFTDLAGTVLLALAGLGGFLVFGPSLSALVIALPLLVVLPGYAVVSMLYPRDGQSSSLGFVARFALAVAVTAATVPAVALLANYVTGIYPLPVLSGVTAITVVASVLASIRRNTVPASERMGIAPLARLVTWYDRYLRGSRNLRAKTPLEARTGRDVFVNLIVLASILVFTASVGIAAMVPQQDPYSEAYLATTNGGTVTIVQDPAGLSSSERESLVAVVENHEQRSVTYSVEVVSQTLDGSGPTAQVRDERIVTEDSKTLSDGDEWQYSLPSAVRGDRVVVNVYKGGRQGDEKPDYHLTMRTH